MQTPKFNIGDVVIYNCDMYIEVFTIDKVKIWKDGSIVYFSGQNILYEEEELEKRTINTDEECHRLLSILSSQSSTDTPIENKQDLGEDEPMFSYNIKSKLTGINKYKEVYGSDNYSEVSLQLSEKVLDNITKELTERICRYDSSGLIKEIIKKHLS